MKMNKGTLALRNNKKDMWEKKSQLFPLFSFKTNSIPSFPEAL